MTRIPSLISLLCAAFLTVLALGGCSAYQLGTGAELPFKSIYVAPVVNRSLAPQAQALLTDQVINRLRQSGKVTVTDRAAADAILTITLIDFERTMSITQSTDTQLARGFELHLKSQVKLVNKSSGEAYLNNIEISSSQQVFGNSSESLVESNAMPELTARLALAIANAVEGGW